MRTGEQKPKLNIMMVGDIGVISDGITFTIVLKGRMMPQLKCTPHNYEMILKMLDNPTIDEGNLNS